MVRPWPTAVVWGMRERRKGRGMCEQMTGARRRGKGVVRGLLAAGDLAGLEQRARQVGGQRVAREVMQLLFDRDEAMRWRAVAGIGRVAAVMAKTGQEPVRELLRRVMWWMNDESGALLWNGPEVMAEILVQVPSLVEEYAHIVPRFTEEEPFERGAYWALSRIAGDHPGALHHARPLLVAALADADPVRRGLAALALGRLGASGAEEDLAALADDPSEITVFDARALDLRSTTVGRLARDAASGVGRG